MKTCFDICSHCEHCKVFLRGPGKIEHIWNKERVAESHILLHLKCWEKYHKSFTEYFPIVTICNSLMFEIDYNKVFFNVERNAYKKLWHEIEKKHIKAFIGKSCPYYLEHWMFKNSKIGNKTKNYVLQD